MLYIILAILLAIALFIAVELLCFAVISVSYKDKKLVINIKTPLLKKVITRDLPKNEEEGEPNGKENKSSEYKDEENPNENKKSLSSEKIDEVKKRVFNSETGFDADELKNVWGEFSETYSYTIGIIKKFLGKLRHRIYVNKTYIKIDYGTDNPAATGIIYGSAWNLLGVIYPILTMYFCIEYPMLDITPDFYGKRFDIAAESIIKVKPVHIIKAAFSSLLVPTLTYLKQKIKKQEEGREKNVR